MKNKMGITALSAFLSIGAQGALVLEYDAADLSLAGNAEGIVWAPSVSTTNILDCTLGAGASVITPVSACFSRAVRSPNSDLITSFLFADFGSAATTDFTFEIWVKAADLSGQKILFETGGGTIGTSILQIDDTVHFVYTSDSTVIADVTGVLPSTPSDFIQIVGVMDVSDGLTLYINGVAVNSAGTTVGQWAGANGGQFGGTDPNVSKPEDFIPVVYDGELALARFYDSALTGDQITALYNAIVPDIDIPTGLSANGGESPVSLVWDDNNQALFDFFTLYRSTTSGSGYSVIASNLTNSSYVDNAVTNGTTYFYVATATDSNGITSAYSTEAAATLSGGAEGTLVLEYNAADLSLTANAEDLVWVPSITTTNIMDCTLGAGSSVVTPVSDCFSRAVRSPNSDIFTGFKPAGLGSSATADFTFEVWVKPADLSGQKILFETGGFANGTGILLVEDTIHFVYTSDSTVIADVTDVLASTPSDFIQIVGVMDVSDGLTLYINGVAVDSVGTTVGQWAGANGGQFGGTDINVAKPTGFVPAIYEGDLTLARFYDAALSPTEVATAYISTCKAIGTDLTTEVLVTMAGSSTNFSWSGSANDTLTIGSAATILTVPDAGGTSPVDLGASALALELGSQWILDGSNYSGTFNVGDRFVLASYGSLTGNTLGIRYRNFALPADRDLQLVTTTTSLYYEVVSQTAATGPNIIVVNVDDMAGGEHFGFDGRDCLSPTLDSLAANGIHFTEAFAASTVCGPSRYALMTGRWPSRNTSDNFVSIYPLGTLGRFGVSDTELENDRENLGAWLQRAGYRTGFVGKAHLIDDDLGPVSSWPTKGLIPYAQSDNPAVDAAVNGAMHHNHRVLSQRMRPYGFDFVGGFYRANLAELRSDALNVHNQEWITKNALDFIDENHNQRFFLYMAPTINHGPVRDDLSKSLLADPRYTSAGYLPNEDYSFMPPRSAIIDEVTTAGKDLISARDTWVDYSAAAIRNKLAAYGIADDTLIIFTADHGERTLPDKVPRLFGKSSLYDIGMRVPLVMNWPNGIVTPGRTYDEIVSHIDFVPTLLELAGATNLPTREVDGLSLVPVLNGSSAALRDDIFCEIGYARGVRSKDWKYIAVRYTPSVYTQINSGYLWKNYKTGLFTEPRPYYVNNSSLGYLAQNTYPCYYDDDQLYDLHADPTEHTNRYGQFPQVAYNLKKRLAGYVGPIPDRPFRQFSDTSTEFSPAPASAPAAPANVQMQFQGLENVQLDWADAATGELGYIIERSTNGAPFEMVDELPSGAGSATVSIDTDIEDIVLRIASYNALGDSAAVSNVDLLAPDSWRYRTFGSTTSSNSQWTADADRDGVLTAWEYAFATDPLDSNSLNRISGRVYSDETNRWLQIAVPRDPRRMATILGRASTSLIEWEAGAQQTEVVEGSDTRLILRSTTPVEDAPSQFLGAEITIP